MAQDDLHDAVFGRLLTFLNRLDDVNASYRLGHTRPGSVMVEIALQAGAGRSSSWPMAQ